MTAKKAVVHRKGFLVNSNSKPGRIVGLDEVATTTWCGIEATLAGGPVSVVDTVDSRFETNVLALGVSGRVPAATTFLERVMGGDTSLLDGDIVYVRDAKGVTHVVNGRELTDLRRVHMGSLAAALGGRPTLALPAGATIPRKPVPAPGEVELGSQVLESGRWGLDKYLRLAAQRFTQTLGIKHVGLASNGSLVLSLAIKLLRIGEGKTVLVPASTFQATAGGMVDVRVVWKLIDCKPGNLTIDPEALLAYLEECDRKGEERPAAVIAVALYHMVPDMRRLREICDQYGMKLILDFAHGPYAEIDGLPITRFAHVVTYSFQQSKSLSLGEGGAIGTDDDELAPALAMLISCGYLPWDQLAARIKEGLVLERSATGGLILPEAFRKQQSVNYRMAEVQAAQLYKRLATFMDVFDRAVDTIAELQEVVRRYDDFIEPLELTPGARGPFYKWGFRVKESWMPADVARWALRRQLNYEVIFCYPALTLADQRNPLVPEALEGLVSDEYFKAVTGPNEVPNAEQAIHHAAMVEWALTVGDNPARDLDHAMKVTTRDTELIVARS